VGRSGSFRAIAQPLVRDSVARGASINDVTRLLRSSFGHAYRRADMLEDMRRYRATESKRLLLTPIVAPAVMPFAPTVFSLSATVTPSLASPVALRLPRNGDHTRWIARAGIAIFAITLLVPTLILDVTRNNTQVLVADVSEVRALGAARREVSLPNQVAALPRRLATPESTTAPTVEPTPVPNPVATPPPSPRQAVAVAGGPGILVTASWYGPGFYENRLPCWQWLLARGLPIQFLPDTWGVAHKTLPCGTMLTLTHGSNTITVPVVDRGPYVAGRELDLSPRVKAALGCTDLCTLLMQIR
jgi:hypothetical protein